MPILKVVSSIASYKMQRFSKNQLSSPPFAQSPKLIVTLSLDLIPRISFWLPPNHATLTRAIQLKNNIWNDRYHTVRKNVEYSASNYFHSKHSSSPFSGISPLICGSTVTAKDMHIIDIWIKLNAAGSVRSLSLSYDVKTPPSDNSITSESNNLWYKPSTMCKTFAKVVFPASSMISLTFTCQSTSSAFLIASFKPILPTAQNFALANKVSL